MTGHVINTGDHFWEGRKATRLSLLLRTLGQQSWFCRERLIYNNTVHRTSLILKWHNGYKTHSESVKTWVKIIKEQRALWSRWGKKVPPQSIKDVNDSAEMFCTTPRFSPRAQQVRLKLPSFFSVREINRRMKRVRSAHVDWIFSQIFSLIVCTHTTHTHAHTHTLTYKR